MATKAEEEWMEKVADFPCIVCFLYSDGARTPAMVHHILKPSGRRMGHLFTIGLCHGHHQSPEPGSGKIARHPTKARFVKKYGTELYLLKRLKALIERKDKLGG